MNKFSKYNCTISGSNPAPLKTIFVSTKQLPVIGILTMNKFSKYNHTILGSNPTISGSNPAPLKTIFVSTKQLPVIGILTMNKFSKYKTLKLYSLNHVCKLGQLFVCSIEYTVCGIYSKLSRIIPCWKPRLCPGVLLPFLLNKQRPFQWGYFMPKLYVDMSLWICPSKIWLFYANFSPNHPFISIPFSRRAPILPKLDAFYNNVLKIHPIHVRAPLSLIKPTDYYTKFSKKHLKRQAHICLPWQCKNPPGGPFLLPVFVSLLQSINMLLPYLSKF